jgi:hypothetical protein
VEITKATELIESLNGFIETYGDHEIRIHGDVNESYICFHVFPYEFFALSNSNEPL